MKKSLSNIFNSATFLFLLYIVIFVIDSTINNPYIKLAFYSFFSVIFIFDILIKLNVYKIIGFTGFLIFFTFSSKIFHLPPYFRYFTVLMLLYIIPFSKSFFSDLFKSLKHYRYVIAGKIGYIVSIIAVLLIFATIFIYSFSSITKRGILQHLWWAFRQVEDPGNLVSEPFPLSLAIISLFLTISGLLLFAFIISLGSSILEEYTKTSFRKKVNIDDHIVILGWKEWLPELIADFNKMLVESNLYSTIVILGEEKYKEDYSMLIEKSMEKMKKRVKVIYRVGNPLDTDDITITNAKDAKLILIPSDDCEKDAKILGSVISFESAIKNEKIRKNIDVIPMIHDYKKKIPLQTVNQKSAANYRTISISQFIGRITAEASVTPGILQFFDEIFTPRGNEIYIKKLQGTMRKNSLSQEEFEKFFLVNNAVLFGVKIDEQWYVVPVNNIEGEKEIQAVAFLSENSDTAGAIKLNKVRVKFKKKRTNKWKIPLISNVIIMGWNKEGFTILEELLTFYKKLKVVVVDFPENIEKIKKDVKEYMKTHKIKKYFSSIIWHGVDYTQLNSYQKYINHSDRLIILPSMYTDDPDSTSIIALLNLFKIEYDKGVVMVMNDRDRASIVNLYTKDRENVNIISKQDIINHYISQIMLNEIFHPDIDIIYNKILELSAHTLYRIKEKTLSHSFMEKYFEKRDEGTALIGYVNKKGEFFINPENKDISLKELGAVELLLFF